MSFHWEDSTSGLNSNSVRIQSEKAGRPATPRVYRVLSADVAQEPDKPLTSGGAGKEHSICNREVAGAGQTAFSGEHTNPRVYSAWIDDLSDDLYQFAEPSYTPRSTFSERVAEIALGGFILLAVVCGLAAKFNW